MTLYRRLVFSITALIICLMAGNLVISVFDSRGYVFEQMQVHAQDAATSLGMTLTHAAGEKDEAQLRTFINAVFDRGYFLLISYRSYGGEVQIESRHRSVAEGTPAWFVDLVRLPQTMGNAEVMSGWQRLGVVNVVSNPASAYADLWRVFTLQCWLFALVAVFSYAVAGIGLRFLLRPLRRVEQQAEAICRREFQLQEEIPSTLELRRVVMAINRMVSSLKSIFREQAELSENLYREAHLDDLTGVSTRKDFNNRLGSFLKSENSGCQAALLLVHISGLNVFNDRAGRAEGDDCLRLLATELTGFFHGVRDGFIGRLSGADFAVFVPYIPPDEAKELFAALLARLSVCHWLESGPELKLHLGATYSDSVMLGNELLQESDLALSQAQRSGRVGLAWHQAGDTESRNASDWGALIRAALEAERFTFFLQPLYSGDGERILQHEILCRLFQDNRCITAGVLLPMAERYGLAVSLDRHILQQVASSEVLPENGQLTMNLSPRSLLDAGFLEWLIEFLKQNGALARRLVLELPEHCLATDESAVRELQRQVGEFGVQLSLDHFGCGASAFRYLQSLPLACLKLDRLFIETLEDDGDSRFYIRSLLQIAHGCDIDLYAEGVESESQWQTLRALGIDGGQGFHLGEPFPVQG